MLLSRRMPGADGSALPGTAGGRAAAVRTAAAAVLTTTLAACGSLQAGAAGGTTPATVSCAAAGLKVRLDTAAARVAAGSYYVPLEFTNITSTACQLSGFPAVAFTSGVAGQQIGAQAALDHSERPAAVVLAPGAIAHAWLMVLDATSYPASKCHPLTAAGLRVGAPGSQAASYVPDRMPACKAALAGSQILTIRPVQPGRARRVGA